MFVGIEAHKASSGNCQGFKWGGAGWSGSGDSGSGAPGAHWFTCCNNCNDDKSCDMRTYHSASSASYCGPCGESQGRVTAQLWKTEFYCGSCSGQNSVQSECASRIRSVYQVPGLCWAFTRCFRGRCTKIYSKKRSASYLPETCFNLQCESGETVQNCPTDCCNTVNPEKCSWGNNKCISQCCGEPSCCSHADSFHLKFSWIAYGLTAWLTITSNGAR